MLNQKKLTDGITVSGQPSAEELQHLLEHGFHTVINLRTPDEEGVLADEERLVEGAGLNYASVPVSPATLDDAAVERFVQALNAVDGQPALVHCHGGGRAGLMALLHQAVTHGWSLQQALAEGEKHGVAPAADSPYRKFFEEFIKRHSPAER